MKKIEEFKDGVPFDPGYSPLSFSFIENIICTTSDYSNMRAMHQKKFKLSQLESKILDLINKNAAFYLGCMLWGGFLSCRFKDSPREILGNHTLKLTDEEKKTLDCAEETKFALNYLDVFDKDCKYFLNRPSKVPEFIREILSSYNEFAQINNNFIEVRKTSDIKLPKSFAHFDKLTNKQLDELRAKINEVINSKKIEGLLEVGFYKV